jgi:hypothetical protein
VESDTLTVPPPKLEPVPPPAGTAAAETLREPERKVAEAPEGKQPGGPPEDYDWKGVIPLLKQRSAGEGPFKDKTTFKNKAAFKKFIRDNVRRVNDSDCSTKPDRRKPDRRSVERAILKYELEQYATFEEKPPLKKKGRNFGRS